jgi:hypothetical protein
MMPIHTYLILLFTVIAVAGVTIAMFWALGVNQIWLGLAAVALALLVRTVGW